MVSAMPRNLSPKAMRRPSARAVVSAVPTSGPISEYMPPSTTANTIFSDTPMPESVSGLT